MSRLKIELVTSRKQVASVTTSANLSVIRKERTTSRCVFCMLSPCLHCPGNRHTLKDTIYSSQGHSRAVDSPAPVYLFSYLGTVAVVRACSLYVYRRCTKSTSSSPSTSLAFFLQVPLLRSVPGENYPEISNLVAALSKALCDLHV
jgi:hypothetical protein